MVSRNLNQDSKTLATPDAYERPDSTATAPRPVPPRVLTHEGFAARPVYRFPERVPELDSPSASCGP
jgi:hypothetical protein